MLKSVLFLRIASALTFIHSVLHAIATVFGKPEAGAQQAAVAAMQANQFLLTGLPRSFWKFYLGLSFSTSILLLGESIVFWQLASLARSGKANLRPVLATFFIAYAVLAINSFTFFFAPPVITELIIAACLLVAFFALSENTRNQTRMLD